MTTPTPPMIATRTDLSRGAFSQVADVYADDPTYLDVRLAEASQVIEDMCNRRLMPFTGLVETHIAYGVSIDGAQAGGGDLAAMGILIGDVATPISRAADVRDFWVHQCAPSRPELWTYTGVSITLTWPWNDTAVTLPAGSWTGPATDTGHLRLASGVTCPPGTEVRITYGGGYTLGYPLPLIEAVRLETVRQLMVELNPEMAPTDASVGDLEQNIEDKIATYVAL